MLLLPTAALAERRRLAAPGGPLAPLAASLAADLAPVLARPVWLPPEKARLSRAGGRCPRDGALLTFDPFAPRRHECPRCGGVYDGDAHYRWWVLGYQLWLAERAVHAAVLYAVLGDPAHARFAARVLDAQADAYLGYPNRDNVLGPSRPFFSTYLESLWLLHVCVALDALRAARAPGVRALSARVRDRVIAPSCALVASYDEGRSNRQVWNSAAFFAASSLLGRERVMAPGRGSRWVGLAQVAERARGALLADGSWYEGDNYHQFAHRGLWYLLAVAARAGLDVDPELRARFALGFTTPFRVALPDLTLPARRDAQYGTSLRQWRWAEWCELGLAWPGAPDAVRAALGGTLARLYDGAAPPRDPGRWRATGESERNEAPAALTRASLGWKSLLFAAAELPAAEPAAPRSVLLDAQGLAVFRRDGGRVWVGFDFGASGGGHGHPDRLNILLADGATRWLDDMGTGSYVERALHWYRSTLAHQAPLVDGRSQPRADGRLLAYDEGDALGWADAAADVAPGVRARRALVVAADHVVDLLSWEAERAVTLDLPFHLEAELAPVGLWRPAGPGGAGGLEDGFDFLDAVETAPAPVDGITRVRASPPDGDDAVPARPLDGWVLSPPGATWWRADAPGPPGTGRRRFVWVRVAAARGTVATVWSLRSGVRHCAMALAPRLAFGAGPRVAVHLTDGTTVTHGRTRGGWLVERTDADGRRTRARLGGVRAAPAVAELRESADQSTAAPGPNPRWASRARVRGLVDGPTDAVDLVLRADGAPLLIRLGKGDYRRSEEGWVAAGRPRALVALGVAAGALAVTVDVRLGRPPHVAPPGAANDMDNERADVNSDGVQLHLRPAGSAATAGWLLVPEPPSPGVRVTPLDVFAATLAVDARAALGARGWTLTCRVPLHALAPDAGGGVVGLDLAVNEMPAERERRRGQLVLSGAERGFVYLRGDRADGPLVRVRLPDSAAGSAPYV